MRELRIALQTAKREVFYIVFWTVLMWGIGVAMVLTLTAFLFEAGDGYVLFGSFFSFIGALAGILASGNLNGNTRFSLAISMGQTRREFLCWNSLLKIMESAGAMLLVFLLSRAENGLYQFLFPGEENVLSFVGEMFAGKWTVWILTGSAVAFAVIDLIMMALMLRFGMKVLYVIIFSTCFLPGLCSKAVTAYETARGGTLLSQLGGLLVQMVRFFTTTIGIGVLVAVVMLILFAAAVYLLRAPVKL